MRSEQEVKSALAVLADGDLLREMDRHNVDVYVDAVAVAVGVMRDWLALAQWQAEFDEAKGQMASSMEMTTEQVDALLASLPTIDLAMVERARTVIPSVSGPDMLRALEAALNRGET